MTDYDFTAIAASDDWTNLIVPWLKELKQLEQDAMMEDGDTESHKIRALLLHELITTPAYRVAAIREREEAERENAGRRKSRDGWFTRIRNRVG